MFRELIIDIALQVVGESSELKELHALEIGCCYSTRESLSTLRIPHFLEAHARNAKFVSIEYDQNHIDAARSILREKAPNLLKRVQFVRGNSLVVLPRVLEELCPVDFAFLDGGLHPEVCLKEFELVVEALASNGLVVVDDVNPIVSTRTSSLPFGKGTLILPYLVVNEYIAERDVSGARFDDMYLGNEEVPNSNWLNSVGQGIVPVSLRDLRHVVVSKGNHGMLVAGRKGPVDCFSQSLKRMIKASVPVKLILAGTRLERALAMLLGVGSEASITIQ